MYQILRRILFLFPAETAHYLSMNLLGIACRIPGIKNILKNSFSYNYPSPVSFFGLAFRNPVGLGAGFDKNARYLEELQTIGFGFIEIGTVTPRAQEGNPKPRLFRLPEDKALVNRMGFNNEGVEAVAERLKEWRKKRMENGVRSVNGGEGKSSKEWPMLIGGNIGKNKTTPNEEAWKDYEICFRALHPHVDFFVVNVSSPNTPGLRELQEKDSLKKILTHLQEMNKNFDRRRPILLKIAPDLTNTQLEDVVALVKEIQLDGLVVANTTISREHLNTPKETLEKIGAGGLSGAPLKRRSTAMLKMIQNRMGIGIPVIASGGIFRGEDALEIMKAGASLIEVWTGFIYEGPFIVKKISKYLANNI